MHIVKRTEESVSNKSVTETHLRTESSTSDFAASCCTAQWLQSGLGAERTVATQHDVAQRSCMLHGAVTTKWTRAERTVATQHHVAQRSGYKVASGPSMQWLRSIMLHSAVATDRTVATEQARAAISSAQWLLRKLEQWFRPHGADRASSSSDFECTVATERA